uniref:Uncharacterized protein n=1 Tax=Tanacetum cinerariifolium TaxID=118510 RepID=A0A6L2J9K9_TANCI|nr:hypothetical protein [Tanacetum cinerariifolium]
MTTLADKAILSGAENHPPMLEKDMYDSWKSRMELYMMNRQYGRMILESVENGPLLWLTVEENGMTDQINIRNYLQRKQSKLTVMSRQPISFSKDSHQRIALDGDNDVLYVISFGAKVSSSKEDKAIGKRLRFRSKE